MSWLYHRPTEGTLAFIETKFGKRPEIAEANTRAFRAGWNYGETSEDFAVSYEVAPAKLAPGSYRQITGQHGARLRADRRVEAVRAAALPRRLPDHAGLVDPRGARGAARSSASSRSRPRTRSPRAAPRSARRSAARSASRPRPGPAIVLKAETVGLAVALELPLLILDIQRAGPSTGMPTKPEQADLLMVLYGRNSESPVPGDRRRRRRPAASHAAIEAARIALTYRTPVYLLSDAYLANGSEPWLIPDVDVAARHPGRVRDGAERRRHVPAVPARPGDARARRGRSRARPGSSTGSAGSRRRTSPATSRTTPTTTT